MPWANKGFFQWRKRNSNYSDPAALTRVKFKRKQTNDYLACSQTSTFPLEIFERTYENKKSRGDSMNSSEREWGRHKLKGNKSLDKFRFSEVKFF